ncbi:Oxysterol-binding protein-domain-containing protein, partial [Endogone sp. FLAS-F59071]
MLKNLHLVIPWPGMLAYYKNQDDANNACRGSINMKYAKIWIDASDKNRFDVIGKGTNRYHLKTEHPVEAKRWIFALSQSKQWIIDLEKGLVNSKGRTSIILDDSHRPQFLTDEDNGSNISAEAKPPVAGRRRASSKVSMTDSIVAARNSTAGLPRGRSHLEPLRNSEDEEDELFESQTEPPLGDEYRTNVNLVLKQVDLQEQLLESLLILTGDGSSGSGQGVAHATKQVMLVDAFRTSLKSLRGLVDEVLDMSEDRETFWRRKFEAEAERRRLWEESMHSLALEQQEMERFVQVVVQERKARRKEKRKKTAEVERGMGGGESEIIIMEEEQEVAQAIPQHRFEDEFGVETDVDGKSESKVMLTEEPEVAAAEEEKGVVEDKKKSVDDKKKAEEFALDEGDLDEEEFFDAISDDEEGPAVPDMSLLSSIAATTTVLPAPENLPDSASVGDNTSVEDMSTTDSGAPSEIASTSNTVATTVQPSPQFTQFTASTSTSSPSQLVPELQVSAVGYPKELRASLPIADNEKPTVSLWSILKNSIGKDLTRITLPVYFNEPTSMLQRMCEDIEYSELLDTAVHQPSSAERMMYVVAFAVSNFSSVPGRVAKPFNPLL